ncbi:MAG: hypothetical protein HQL73_05325 [Magnetococcales bacterium]|nr:hypothetical protein [Magnetococcales bacterium]
MANGRSGGVASSPTRFVAIRAREGEDQDGSAMDPGGEGTVSVAAEATTPSLELDGECSDFLTPDEWSLLVDDGTSLIIIPCSGSHRPLETPLESTEFVGMAAAVSACSEGAMSLCSSPPWVSR